MEARPLFIHALTPVHTGTGQSADVIDLPISREKTTGWPQVPGSSIKGVLKDEYRGKNGSLFVEAFGPEQENASDGAGMLIFGDAKILCLAVRSFFGTFAWVTCPHIITRYNRDFPGTLSEVEVTAATGDNGPNARVASDCALKQNNTVYLEDLDFAVEEQGVDELASQIAQRVFPTAGLKDEQKKSVEKWQGIFKKRLIVVSDDMFGFLSETATEVTARIAMDDNLKTVKKGGLWYEEAVPAESIFWSAVVAEARNGKSASDLWTYLNTDWPSTIQVGGNATVGRGLVRPVLGGLS